MEEPDNPIVIICAGFRSGCSWDRTGDSGFFLINLNKELTMHLYHTPSTPFLN